MYTPHYTNTGHYRMNTGKNGHAVQQRPLLEAVMALTDNYW